MTITKRRPADAIIMSGQPAAEDEASLRRIVQYSINVQILGELRRGNLFRYNLLRRTSSCIVFAAPWFMLAFLDATDGSQCS